MDAWLRFFNDSLKTRISPLFGRLGGGPEGSGRRLPALLTLRQGNATFASGWGVRAVSREVLFVGFRASRETSFPE